MICKVISSRTIFVQKFENKKSDGLLFSQHSFDKLSIVKKQVLQSWKSILPGSNMRNRKAVFPNLQFQHNSLFLSISTPLFRIELFQRLWKKVPLNVLFPRKAKVTPSTYFK